VTTSVDQGGVSMVGDWCVPAHNPRGKAHQIKERYPRILSFMCGHVWAERAMLPASAAHPRCKQCASRRAPVARGQEGPGGA